MKKLKSYTTPRLAILICMAVLCAGLSVFAITLFFGTFKKDETAKVEAVTSLSGSGTAGSPYLIGNKAELNFFAQDVAKGNTYLNSYVKLTANINYEDRESGVYGDLGKFRGVGINLFSDNKNSQSFAGIFDGQGYTIKNFYVNARSAMDVDSADGDNVDAIGVGFFGGLCGLNSDVIVRNLKLENFELWVDSDDPYNSGFDTQVSIGGIAGVACGTGKSGNVDRVQISNCAVKNMRIVRYNDNIEEFYIGGIVGAEVHYNDSFSISNCSVDGMSAEDNKGEDLYFWSGGLGVASNSDFVGAFIGFSNSPSFINCVADNLSVNLRVYDGDAGYWQQYLANGWIMDTIDVSVYATWVDNGRVQGRVGQDDNYASITNKSSTPSTTSAYAWYYASDYNNGVPKLRKFMEFTACTITSNYTAWVGAKNKTSTTIDIPKDAEKRADLSQKTDLSLILFGQTINAYPNEKYVCEHASATWTAKDNLNYTVELHGQERVIKFATTVSNVKYSGDSDSGIASFQCGTIIEVSGNKYSAIDAYRDITIVYIDSHGDERTAKYTAAGGYYIELKNLHNYFSRNDTSSGSADQYGNDTTNIILHDNYTFTPVVKQMDYELDMQ